jgi:hypothetical protein
MGNLYPAEFRAQVVELHRRQGRPLAELRSECHSSATTVANWVCAANAADAKDPTLTSQDKAELVLWRRQLKARERSWRSWETRWPSSRADKTARGRCLHQRGEGHPTRAERGPQVPGAGVSRSGDYAWRARLAGPPGRRATDDLAVLDQIRQVHARFACYGSPRGTASCGRARPGRSPPGRATDAPTPHRARWGRATRARSVPPNAAQRSPTGSGATAAPRPQTGCGAPTSR